MLTNNETDSNKKAARLYGSGIGFYFFIITVHFLWALSVPLTKICYQHLHVTGTLPFQLITFAGVRLFGSGIIGLFFVAIKGVPLLPKGKQEWTSLIKLCILMSIIQYILFNFGMNLSSGIEVSILNSTGSFIGIFLTAMLFKDEPLTLRKLLGCTMGVISVILLNIHDLKSGMIISVLGGIFILLSQTSGTAGSIYLRKVSSNKNAIWVGGWQSLLGGTFLVIFGNLGGGFLPYAAYPAAILSTLLIIASSGLALIFSSQLYKYAPLSKVYIFSLLAPVLGVLLSALILGESLNSLYLAGSLLLDLIGIACVTMQK